MARTSERNSFLSKREMTYTIIEQRRQLTLTYLVMSHSQHAQMLVVRKEGKAHARYNSFRSAFELLEAVGREPHDAFDEVHEDLPPLQKLEQRLHKMEQMRQPPSGKPDQQTQKQMQQQMEQMKQQMKQQMEQQIEKMKQQMEQQMEQMKQQMEQMNQQMLMQQEMDHQKQNQMKQYQLRTQQQIDVLREENKALRSRLDKQHDVGVDEI